MVRCRRPPSQGWKTFLRNHAAGIASLDLFVVRTISFKLLYGLVILRHARRRLVTINVTSNPTAAWLAGQVTDAFPWDERRVVTCFVTVTEHSVQPIPIAFERWVSAIIRPRHARRGRRVIHAALSHFSTQSVHPGSPVFPVAVGTQREAPAPGPPWTGPLSTRQGHAEATFQRQRRRGALHKRNSRAIRQAVARVAGSLAQRPARALRRRRWRDKGPRCSKGRRT